LPRFDGHLMIASSAAKGVRCEYEEPAEVHAGVQGRGCGDGGGSWGQHRSGRQGAGHLRLDAGELGAPGPRAGRRCPTAEERVEIRDLKRELERTRRERDILARAVAFFSGPRGSASDRDVLVHRRGEGRLELCVERGRDVPHAGRVPPGVLRLGDPAAVGPPGDRPVAGRGDRSHRGVLGPHLRGAPGARLAGSPGLPGVPQVARIMRTHGWVGVSGRRRPRTTIVDRNARAAEDLVARNFNPTART
jgi:hypothetical protein